MKKKFSQFADDSERSVGADDERSADVRGESFDMIKSLAEKYEGASENELISAILNEAIKARAAGTLSDAEIDSFVAGIEPMLSANQRKRLQTVVNKIKKL